jgi:uncharacterized cupredoxin-like copper-binding protein
MPRRIRIAFMVVAAATLVACAGINTPPGTTHSAGTAPPEATPSASPSASPAASPSNAGGNTAVLSEWKIDVASTVKAGNATFTISNSGTIPHELLVFKSNLKPSAYPTDAAGGIIEEGAGVALVSDGDNIEPGGSQSRTVDLAPGTYLFVCNIPGHFKAGMFTVVTVTP